jgi:hypothetical protein
VSLYYLTHLESFEKVYPFYDILFTYLSFGKAEGKSILKASVA